MKKLLLVLPLLLTVSCNAPAQSGPASTVYQTLASNSQTAASDLRFGPVTNIGQAFHQVYVSLKSTSGHTCVPASVTISLKLYGSSAATIGTEIGYIPQTQITSSNVLGTFLYDTVAVQGIGPYPYVYVYLTVSDVVNCNYSLYYEGGLSPSNQVDTSNAFLTSFHANSPAATVVMTTGSATNAGVTANVYQATLSLSAAGNINVQCGGTAIDTFFMAANTSLTFPVSSVPWWSCNGASNLQFVLSQTGSVTTKYKLEH